MPLPAVGAMLGAAPVATILRPLLRALLVAGLCIALVVLGGCSVIRLGYNQADWMAYRWLDAYADFDEAQAPRVREAINAWFAWHRRTQLGDYSDLLLRFEAELSADTSAERVCGWWGAVRTRIDRGLEQAVPAIAELAMTLRPAQLGNIEQRYAKSNAEFREEFLQQEGARRIVASVKRAIGRSETLYGDIDPPQRERFERWAAESPFDPNLALEERLRRQQDALQTLRRVAGGPASSATAQAQIRGWLQRFDPSPRESYRLLAERVVRHNCRLAADLHNSTSADQRRFASKKLRDWAADLRALAVDAGA